MDKVDLNAVTIGNMSIDSNPVARDGERGRYRKIIVDSCAGESVVNPDDWPNIDLKPSKASVKGQRYVVPGGEKIDNLGELTVKVRTGRHGGRDISSRVTFQGAKVRKPLLAVSNGWTKHGTYWQRKWSGEGPNNQTIAARRTMDRQLAGRSALWRIDTKHIGR